MLAVNTFCSAYHCDRGLHFAGLLLSSAVCELLGRFLLLLRLWLWFVGELDGSECIDSLDVSAANSEVSFSRSSGAEGASKCSVGSGALAGGKGSAGISEEAALTAGGSNDSMLHLLLDPFSRLLQI